MLTYLTSLSQATSDKESLENVNVVREQQVAEGDRQKKKKQLQKNVSPKHSSLPKNFTFYAGRSAPVLQSSSGKDNAPDNVYESFVGSHYHHLLNGGIF